MLDRNCSNQDENVMKTLTEKLTNNFGNYKVFEYFEDARVFEEIRQIFLSFGN